MPLDCQLNQSSEKFTWKSEIGKYLKSMLLILYLELNNMKLLRSIFFCAQDALGGVHGFFVAI